MTPELTSRQEIVLRALLGDLPDGPEPYDALAAQAGVPVEEFLTLARELLLAGYLRKVAGVLHHRRAGFMGNALCVWKVGMERIEQTGRLIAGFPEVTHCYQRSPSNGWPYSLYCMVHARTREECDRTIARIAASVAPEDHQVLYSTRELKKRSAGLP